MTDRDHLARLIADTIASGEEFQWRGYMSSDYLSGVVIDGEVDLLAVADTILDQVVTPLRERVESAEAAIARVRAQAVQMDLEQSHIAANRIRAALKGQS